MKKRILSIFLVLAILATFLPQFTLSARAASSGECGGNLTWSFNESKGKLTITGSGAMTNWITNSDVPWYTFAGNIRTLSLPDKLTSIGSYAFYFCSSLTSVTIPDSVTSIEKYAFQYCSSLKSAHVGKGVMKIAEGIFRDCEKLTSVTIRSRDCDIFQSSSTTLGNPGTTTIYGYKKSTAERFALDKGYSFKDLNDQFKDVPSNAFYAEPVAWAVENAITNGLDKMHFGPNATCTRGQVVTFLWRAAGCPSPRSSKNPFKDVKKSAFYYEAVLWAVEKNVTAGTSKTTFSPNAGCTRGQVVTFLWRSVGSPKPKNSSNPFKDVKKSAFYYDAVLWAVRNKVTSGMTKTTFVPNNICNRGQVVTFLYRMSQLDEQNNTNEQNEPSDQDEDDKPTPYVVSFDAKGGTVSQNSIHVYYGKPYGTLPTPKKSHYQFNGWYTSDGTRIKEDTIFKGSSNTTLYARWTPKQFTVTFNANGGTTPTSQKTVTYGQAIGSLPTPNRDYYYSNGWYTESSGGTQITENYVFPGDSDVTVYARWTLKTPSDWTYASYAPSDAQIVERKWRYTKTYYTSSSSSTLSGWTQYDSSWSWGSWGSWSSWSDSSVALDSYTDIGSRCVYAYYYYQCPNCGAHMHGWGITCPTWANGCGKATIPESSWHVYWSTTTHDAAGFKDWHGTGHYYAYVDGILVFKWSDGMNRGEAIKWQYRYRTRSKIWTYYFYQNETLESSSYPSGSDISNIVEYVRYRPR